MKTIMDDDDQSIHSMATVKLSNVSREFLRSTLSSSTASTMDNSNNHNNIDPQEKKDRMLINAILSILAAAEVDDVKARELLLRAANITLAYSVKTADVLGVEHRPPVKGVTTGRKSLDTDVSTLSEPQVHDDKIYNGDGEETFLSAKVEVVPSKPPALAKKPSLGPKKPSSGAKTMKKIIEDTSQVTPTLQDKADEEEEEADKKMPPTKN
jgi:hypothetical protein